MLIPNDDIVIDLRLLQDAFSSLDDFLSQISGSQTVVQYHSRFTDQHLAMIDAMLPQRFDSDAGGGFICFAPQTSVSGVGMTFAQVAPQFADFSAAWGWALTQPLRICAVIGNHRSAAVPTRLVRRCAEFAPAVLPTYCEYLDEELLKILLLAALRGAAERGFSYALLPNCSVFHSELLRAFFLPYVTWMQPVPVNPKNSCIMLVEKTQGLFHVKKLLDMRRRGLLDIDLRKIILLNENREGPSCRDALAETGIDVEYLPWLRANESRAQFDRRLHRAVARVQPHLVVLNWTHIVSNELIDAFPQMLNLHGAYLPLDPRADTLVVPDGKTIPARRGMKPLDDAVAQGQRWLGTSLHRVTPELDRGSVLARYPIASFIKCNIDVILEVFALTQIRGLQRWLYDTLE